MKKNLFAIGLMCCLLSSAHATNGKVTIYNRSGCDIEMKLITNGNASWNGYSDYVIKSDSSYTGNYTVNTTYAQAGGNAACILNANASMGCEVMGMIESECKAHAGIFSGATGKCKFNASTLGQCQAQAGVNAKCDAEATANLGTNIATGAFLQLQLNTKYGTMLLDMRRSAATAVQWYQGQEGGDLYLYGGATGASIDLDGFGGLANTKLYIEGKDNCQKKHWW